MVFLLARAYVTDIVKVSGVMDRGPEAFVLAMSPDQRAAWLGAIIDAEGTAKGDYVMIAQNAGPLCDAIQLAIYLEGHRPNRRGGTGRLTIGLGDAHVAAHRFAEPQPLERQQVWCVVTTELGTWTAGQDGQFFLTGNSAGQVLGGRGPGRDRAPLGHVQGLSRATYGAT